MDAKDSDYTRFLAERKAEIEDTIAAAAQKSGRCASDIELICVSKTVDVDAVECALDTRVGYAHFGENRPQELKRKVEALSGEHAINTDAPDAITFDMIGNLQTNKINVAIKYARLIHSVSSLHLAEAISKRAAQQNIVARVLLELNISGEASKSGMSTDELFSHIDELMELPALSIEGVMTMAPAHSETLARQTFIGLRSTRDELKVRTGLTLAYMSCGMSDDFAIAIEEGSTLVRLGRTVFSPAYTQS